MPKLSLGNEVLHKDRRFIVFRVNEKNPYKGYEEHYSILVYDRRFNTPVGFIDNRLHGICNPSTYQNSLPISGDTAADLVQSVRKALKTFRTYS